MEDYCGNPGRGSHRLAAMAAERIYETREHAARMFSLREAENVVLTQNATHALNLAILGTVQRGDHVLLCDMAHNSTLRPLEYLKRSRGVEYSVFSTEKDVLESIEKHMRKSTSTLICTHASNISNSLLPLEEMGKYLFERGIRFIVDASQSAGTHPIKMEEWRINALCMAGHKGLCGPQGTGLALFSGEPSPTPLLYGGSGFASLEKEMPPLLPERLEAGTQATPSIVGLLEGMKYVESRGAESIFKHECRVMDSIRTAFAGEERLETYSTGEGGIWLFNVKGISPQRVAEGLDREGICTRAGLHCAPLAHKTLKTPPWGAVRASVGPMNTKKDAERFVKGLMRVLWETKKEA